VKGKRVKMMSLCPPGQVEQKKRDRRVSVRTELAATTWWPAGSSGRRGARKDAAEEGSRARTRR
jgi:hypothetical protein